jgi:hypothetical protein
LIALIINVHTLGRMLAARTPKTEVKRRYAAGSLIRKTSLLRKIEPVMRRSSFTNKDAASATLLRGSRLLGPGD